MGHWFKGKNVNDRYGRISDDELIQAIDSMGFDNGETEIFVAQKKKTSPKKCEHFVNINGGKKEKRTQVLS